MPHLRSATLLLLVVAAIGGFAALGFARLRAQRDPVIAELLADVRAQRKSLESLSIKADRLLSMGICAQPRSDDSDQTARLTSAFQAALDQRTAQLKIERRLEAEPTKENIEAYDTATRIVECALATQQWNEDNATSIRRLRRLMTAQQRNTLSLEIISTLNRGGMVMDFQGPPY
jgi:hypothetical protein